MGRPGRALQSDRMVHRIAKCKIPALWPSSKTRQHSGQLVFVWHMDVAGVALGTVIAQYCGLTLPYIIATVCTVGSAFLIHSSPLPYSGKTPLAVSSVSTATFSCAPFASCASLSISPPPVPVKWEYILAANALLMQYFTLYSYFMDGFAFAGEALSGKCAGAGDYQALKKVIRNLFLGEAGVALTFTPILYGRRKGS